MSEHKKVIHVKDLVIKADNVHIEPERHRRGPRRDPFFGRWMGRDWEEESKESFDKHDRHDESPENDKGKGPSWI